MRRFLSPCVGALAFLVLTGLAWAASAQESPPPNELPSTTTTLKPTTTAPPTPLPPPPTSTTSTTSASGKATTTTSTTVRGTGSPVPPPASGPSQPLDPGLVGGSLIPLDTSTTLFGVETTTTSTTSAGVTPLGVSNKKHGPSGPTLGLAAVAWLASLGGLLVYAEDQRGKQWRHLAR